MKVADALRERHSCRAFLGREVDLRASMLKRIDPLALRKTDPGGAQRLIAVSGGLVRRPTKGLLSNGAISGAGAEVGEEKNEVEIAARDCLLGRRSGARMA